MNFDRDAITIDMASLNEQRADNAIPMNTLHANSLKCHPDLDRSGYKGCRTEKQCAQINRELDTEQERLRRLRRQYDMGQFKKCDPHRAYLLDPNDDSSRSGQVTYSPFMYSLDVGGPNGTGDLPLASRDPPSNYPLVGDPALFRVNPNKHDVPWPEEDQLWRFEPGSQTNVVRKKEVEERQKLRIYPHMFSGTVALEKDRARRARENEMMQSVPSIITGGVDYPVPMYFQLGSLQQPARPAADVDYDMRIRTKRRCMIPQQHDITVPEQLMIENNVDIDRARLVNEGILEDKFREPYRFLRGDRRRQKLPHGRTAGVPKSRMDADMTCSQMSRRNAQVKAIRKQPHDWYTDAAKQPYTQYETVGASPIRRPTSSEKNVFSRDVSLSLAEKGPDLERTKSSFFGLGPALPPPDPMLLSNVPSRLLMHRQAVQASDDRSIAAQARLEAAVAAASRRENFSGGGGGGIEHFSPSPSGDVLTAKMLDGGPENGASVPPGEPGHFSVRRDQPLKSAERHPLGTYDGVPVANRDEMEFQVARSSLEKSAKDIVHETIRQQRRALMQISDLRHSIAALKQRIVDARAHADNFDTVSATRQMENAQHSIGRLRDAIDALAKRRERAMERLKAQLTSAEYGYTETQVANLVKVMETRVRQYHNQPAADAIEAFKEPHFSGDGFVMKKGFYGFPNVGGIGNNKLASLKIGEGVKVKLYEHASKRGRVLTYVGPRRIPLMPSMWDRAVSGIEVMPKEGPLIKVYDAPFFQGSLYRLPLGGHDYPNVGGIQATKTASMEIPEGLEVTLFSRPKFEGETTTFIGPQRVAFLPADWNSKVFGIRIKEKS